jgi:hypothetical protein
MDNNSSNILPRRSLTAWIAAYLLPLVFFAVVEAGDLIGFTPGPGAGWLVYCVPLTSTLLCLGVIWLSPVHFTAKAGWSLFTVFAVLLQFILLVAIFGLLAIGRDGLEGTH